MTIESLITCSKSSTSNEILIMRNLIEFLLLCLKTLTMAPESLDPHTIEL